MGNQNGGGGAVMRRQAKQDYSAIQPWDENYFVLKIRAFCSLFQEDI